MALAGPPASIHSMSSLRGYSDFFASGFRAVSNRVRRRPASIYSLTVTDATENDQPTPTVSRIPTVFQSRSQRRQGRPMSMIVQSSSSNLPSTSEGSTGRRSSFALFSSRFFDHMPFTSPDESSASSSHKPKDKRLSRSLRPSHSDYHAPEVWITAGGPFTPSVPNGSPDIPRLRNSMDPFASSPESRSLFIDLSDSSPSHTPKRDSFLSMTTNSSPARSLVQLPRRERPISIQTMPLPSRSRRSSFQYRPPSREKSDFWILEEEPDIIAPEPLVEDYEPRDDAAQIDWRQFHNDLLTVEV